MVGLVLDQILVYRRMNVLYLVLLDKDTCDHFELYMLREQNFANAES
jgi:hypothetical protein